MLCDECLEEVLMRIYSAKDLDCSSEEYQNYIDFEEKTACSVCEKRHLNHYYEIEETICNQCAYEKNVCQKCRKDMITEEQGKQLFELYSKSNEGYDWAIRYTGIHSKRDISYLDELLETVEKVYNALKEDYYEIFNMLELTLVDTLDLMSILGEIEMFSGWNNFERRDPNKIAKSIMQVLGTYLDEQ